MNGRNHYHSLLIGIEGIGHSCVPSFCCIIMHVGVFGVIFCSSAVASGAPGHAGQLVRTMAGSGPPSFQKYGVHLDALPCAL